MRRFLFGLLFAAALSAPGAAAQTRYLAQADDIPMPPSLEEVAPGFAFSGPDGRLIETVARGAATSDAIKTFYQAALPALGWSEAPMSEGPMVFQRAREKLTIAIIATAGSVEVRYRLISRSASMALD